METVTSPPELLQYDDISAENIAEHTQAIEEALGLTPDSLGNALFNGTDLNHLQENLTATNHQNIEICSKSIENAFGAAGENQDTIRYFNQQGITLTSHIHKIINYSNY